MQKIYQGIILKSVPYKESDAIITLLTKEGLISFKARGIHKINSKNVSLVQLYTIGEYKLDEKTDYSNKTLISGSSLYFPLAIYEDLKYSCLLSFISETIINFKDEYSEAYEIIETVIRNLDKIDILTMTLMVQKYILKWNGVIFEVEKCMKGYNFSISNLSYLKTIRLVLKANIENIFSYQVDEIIGHKILIDLFKYIENNLGVYHKTKDMLFMVMNNTDSRLTR